ncbi:hybrid sensor histidine kinase/response regulator transcription factor [Leeuwenhoekiella parthenopeia]|uniref:histidine kinase n=1 Tax=Leeuwenhoekiella parthenopeia TaxID=2890320 RepID=A0ABS8GPR5_9FLAO|nr:response regulator [Leeuwenhoekiella parthenopeia]MCC4211994.1 response regulator [Leeuwenhoekiella parthenopeia]
MSKKLLSVLVFCIIAVGVFGQRMHFKALTVQDGLSQHDVSAILQDSEGFVWIGTYDGLNRFDGFEVNSFFHENNNSSSLSSNRISCLFEDNKKRIWAGTDGYGLNYYSLEDGKINRVAVPENFGIINDIVQDRKGNIFVATSQGLLKLIEQNNRFSVEIMQTALTSFNIRDIEILNDESFLYATDNGIWQSRGQAYKLIKGSEDASFNTLIQSKDYGVWIGSPLGLYQLVDGKLISKFEILNSNILTLSKGTSNDLWLSTFKEGLYSLNLETLQITTVEASDENLQNSLVNNPLLYVYVDASSTLWVSNKKGLVYTNLENKKFRSLPISEKGHVRTLFATNKSVYYGIQADRFYIYTFKNELTEPVLLPEGAKPFKVDTLKGIVHLATTKGLFKQNSPDEKKFIRSSIFRDAKKDNELLITSFCEDMFGNEYYGSFNGLILKTKDYVGFIQDRFENLGSLRNLRIVTLKVDHFNSCIWVGTISNGLFKLNLDFSGNVLSMETYKEQIAGAYNIPNNSIWCFYQSENGSLYIGTDTGLLLKKQNQNKIETVVIEDFPDKKIMGIISDNFSNLWLNNSQGIIKYSPQSNQAKLYNYDDGLLTNTFTEAISKNRRGELFFGNIAGINYFQSGEMKDNSHPSKILFTELEVNNTSVSVDEEIGGTKILKKRLNNTNDLTFNHKQNDFTIKFSSSNYANIRATKYRYKLEDYDDDWIKVGSSDRYASYSNLPSGNFSFVVEATNPNGEWSGLERTIEINIRPAPWLSWWAYLLYVVLVLVIIFTLIYFWFNKERLRTQIKLSNFKNEQEKEINEMKLVFFTDIAHEFKTPLSLIVGPIDDLHRGNITNKHREFCHNILLRNTNRMMNLVDQLLDFRKINSGLSILRISRNDICILVKEIKESFSWQAKNTNVTFSLIAPESYYCHFDGDILEKVIYNLLSNAFKYTPYGGTVEIEVKPTWKEDMEYLIILVKDSGKGISAEDKRRIFDRHFHGKDRSSSGIGLHLSSTLIKAHKGEINVLSSSLGGTEFMITLPVSSKAFIEEEYATEDEIVSVIINKTAPGKAHDFEEDLADNNKEKILIVEDDYDLRKYLKNILINDYSIIEASNGLEGLDLCLEDQPDLIITDVMMPEMDGIEMCRAIKSNILISHIPVLMLTAKAGEEFKNQGLNVGAWDYIDKPFNSYQFLQKIKNISETRNDFRKQIINGSTEKTESHYISYDQKFVQNASAIISDKISDSDFSVEDLCQELGLSRMHLHRKIKSLTGLSTTAFINTIRIKKAINLFENGCDRVQEAMDAVGISSYAHFNLLFKKEKDITPGKYIEMLRRRNKSRIEK